MSSMPWRADLPVQYITSDRFEKLIGLYSRMSVDAVDVLTALPSPAFIILVLVEHRSGLTEAQKRLAQFRTNGARSSVYSGPEVNNLFVAHSRTGQSSGLAAIQN